MQVSAPPGGGLRFGLFWVDVRSGELQKSGRKVRLQDQPFRVLAALLMCPGEVVSREELRAKIWPADTFVDFDEGLNTAIRKLRRALGDSAENPRFIETIPRRGYRFIAPVERVAGHTAVADGAHDASRIDEGVAGDGGKRGEQPSYFWIFATALILVSAASLTLLIGMREKHGPNFESMRITNLTDDGQITSVAVSPDARYVVMVRRRPEGNSLWVRQVATGSMLQLIAPENTLYQGVAYSPDGNYIYFSRTRKEDDGRGDIYRIAALGGETELRVLDADSPPGFSPDGRWLTFVRNDRAAGKSEVVLADQGGKSERILAVRDLAVPFKGMPSWSPDSHWVAAAAEQYSNGLGAIVFAPVFGGSSKVLLSHMLVEDALWMPDGKGLLVLAYPNGKFFNQQIWYQPYPRGQPRHVTNDPGSYTELSVSADGSTVATLQRHDQAAVYVGPTDSLVQMRPITTAHNDGIFLEWLPTGKLLLEDTKFHFSIADADGQHRTPLLTEQTLSAEPAACPDGRYVVFTSLRGGKWNLWRLDLESRNLFRLSEGEEDDNPSCSPDSRWVLFDTTTAHGFRLERVSLHGGPVIVTTKVQGVVPRYSPDGKLVAFWHFQNQSGQQKTTLAIMKVDGGPVLREFAPATEGMLNNRALMRWLPDQSAITYVLRHNGASDLWVQPLAGGAPQRYTHFGDLILRYDFSSDGRLLAVTRGRSGPDVVLLGNLH